MPDSPFGVPENLAPFGDEPSDDLGDPTKYVPPGGYRHRRDVPAEDISTPAPFVPPAQAPVTAPAPAPVTPPPAPAPVTPPPAPAPFAPPPAPVTPHPVPAPFVPPPAPAVIAQAPSAPPESAFTEAVSAEVPTPTVPVPPPVAAAPAVFERYSAPFKSVAEVEPERAAVEPEPSHAEEPTRGPRSSRRTKRRGKKTLVAAGTLVTLGGLGFGGWYAYGALDGGGLQPSDVITADAIGYAGVDLDPSLSQKVNVAKAVRDEAGVDVKSVQDLPKVLLEQVPYDECNMTYGADFKPWVGKRFAVAAETVEGRFSPIIAVQVTDEEAAAATAGRLGDCGSLAGLGVTVGNGYIVFTDAATSDKATQVIEGTAPSLAEAPAYQSAMKGLGDPGFASFWVSTDAAVKAFGNGFLEGEASTEGMTPPTETIAGVLRLTDGTLDLPVQVKYKPGKAPAVTGGVDGLEQAPSSAGVLLALPKIEADFTKALPEVLTGPSGSIPGGGEDTADVADTLQSLLAEPTVLIGGLNEDKTFWAGGRAVTSTDQAKKTAKGLSDLLESFGGQAVGVEVVTSDGATVAGTDKKAVERFNETKKAVSDPRFTSVMKDWKGAAAALFVNFNEFPNTVATLSAAGVVIEQPQGDIQTVHVRATLN